MNLGNLQTIGLVVCVGAIILVVLVALAARSLFGRRNSQPMNRTDETGWGEQGQERPQYDSPEVQSRGGFGNAPSTSSRNRVQRQTGLPSTGRRGTNVAPRSSGDRLQAYRRQQNQQPSTRPPREDDDNDVSSKGGFGG